MPRPDSSDALQSQPSPGGARHVGVVGRTEKRDQGFVFVLDRDNEEHFAHKSAWEPRRLFDTVEAGTPVSFLVSKTPKGLRAFNIQLATPEEQRQVAEMEESRGNR